MKLKLFKKSRKNKNSEFNKENTDLLIDNLIISTNTNLNRGRSRQSKNNPPCETYKNKVNFYFENLSTTNL